MELAAGRLLDAIQNSNQLSVGVDLNIKHLNATPVGQEVTATATYIGIKDCSSNLKLMHLIMEVKLEKDFIQEQLLKLTDLFQALNEEF
jgi:predicted thioesterase